MFATFLLWMPAALVTPRREYLFTTPSLARDFILRSKRSRHNSPGNLAILPNRFHPSSLPSIHRTHGGDFREDIRWVVLPIDSLDHKLVFRQFLSRIESTLGTNTRALDGQRRSSLPQPNNRVSQTESPYRAPLSLYSTGSGEKQACGQDYPWEGQPMGYPHENHPHEYGECLEVTMDETDWVEWLDFLENYDETSWIEG